MVEAHPSLERVYYEARIYGVDVYYGFAQHLFWQMVVKTQNPDYMSQVPKYYLIEKESK